MNLVSVLGLLARQYREHIDREPYITSWPLCYVLTVIPVIPLHNIQVISDCSGVTVSHQFRCHAGLL